MNRIASAMTEGLGTRYSQQVPVCRIHENEFLSDKANLALKYCFKGMKKATLHPPVQLTPEEEKKIKEFIRKIVTAAEL